MGGGNEKARSRQALDNRKFTHLIFFDYTEGLPEDKI